MKKQAFVGLLSSVFILSGLVTPEVHAQETTGVVVQETLSSPTTYQVFGLGVNAPSQEQIAKYYQDSAKASIATAGTYSAEPSYATPYSAGILSDKTNDAALDTLNFIRYMAGIDYNVTLSSEHLEKTQAGAFVSAVNNKLSHTPSKPSSMSTTLFSLAYSGASSSNLGHNFGNLGTAMLEGWMADADDGNINQLGHRRWLLNPLMGEVAFGYTSSYTAMYCFDQSNEDAEQSGIAWPAQNMPTQFFEDDYPWSYSAGEEVTFAVVTLTRLNDGKKWNFSSSSNDGFFTVNNAAYGQKGCIIFRPDNISYNPGDVFQVKISGTVTAEYIVSFFDLEKTTPGTTLTASATPSSYTYDPSKVELPEVVPEETPVVPEEESLEPEETPEIESDSSENQVELDLNGASVWAIPFIEEANSKGLLKNISDVTSNFTGDITRGQFCRLIMNCYEAAGGEIPETNSNVFTDTTDEIILQANALGIVSGKTTNTFVPNDKISRQELAVMVYRTVENFQTPTITQDSVSFADKDSIDFWAMDSVIYANQINAIAGLENGNIEPHAYLTCEQAILVANRVLDFLTK